MAAYNQYWFIETKISATQDLGAIHGQIYYQMIADIALSFEIISVAPTVQEILKFKKGLENIGLRRENWFTILDGQFSFCFHQNCSISNFWLCLFKTQV